MVLHTTTFVESQELRFACARLCILSDEDSMGKPQAQPLFQVEGWGWGEGVFQ